jgi:hypothetical protein
MVDDGLDVEAAVDLPGPHPRRSITRSVDGDHIGRISGVCELWIARQVNVNSSKCSAPETKAKNGQAPFEAEEAFFERNASGLGRRDGSPAVAVAEPWAS